MILSEDPDAALARLRPVPRHAVAARSPAQGASRTLEGCDGAVQCGLGASKRAPSGDVHAAKVILRAKPPYELSIAKWWKEPKCWREDTKHRIVITGATSLLLPCLIAGCSFSVPDEGSVFQNPPNGGATNGGATAGSTRRDRPETLAVEVEAAA